MMQPMTDTPDLASARVFVETAALDSVDRWYVLPNNPVLYIRQLRAQLASIKQSC